jgi:hypothetical protein
VDTIADDDGQGDAPEAEGIDEDEPDASDELPTEGEPTEDEILDEDLPDDDPDDPADINDNVATLPCIASVREGDTVMVAMRNGEPTVIGSVGWGDRQDAAIGLAQRAAAAAELLANQAKAVADATGQHFWSDDNGIHITEAEQADWETQASGRNILINSLGILLRNALNYLVSITQGAIAFYDGLGNSASNMMASFGRSGTELYSNGSQVASFKSTGMGVGTFNGIGGLYRGANITPDGVAVGTSGGTSAEFVEASGYSIAAGPDGTVLSRRSGGVTFESNAGKAQNGSIAVGEGATATGKASAAFGTVVSAYEDNQFVVGRYNKNDAKKSAKNTKQIG